MSVGVLATYIGAAILAQVAALLAFALFRHFRKYWALQSQLAGVSGQASRPSAPRPAAAGTWTGFREFTVIRKVFEDRSRSVCSFHLAPVDHKPLPAFTPGQYLTFRLDVGGKPLVRCYSLSDRPDPGHYRISVKRAAPPAGRPEIPPGLGSGHLHDRVHEGDRLWAKAPSGHFVLQAGDEPAVMIAGGIGLTPLLSMINTILARKSSREIWLFYGVRNSAEHAMKDHLEGLARTHPNFRLHVCYSKPLPRDVPGVDFQHEGRVDIDLLRLTLGLKPYRFYVCGSAAMMESIVPALSEWGVPEARIHYEAFGPSSLAKPASPASPAPTAAAPAVNFAKSGKVVTWNPAAASLLEFAEDNGIKVESGCRAGGCGACQTEIGAGEVVYATAPDHDPEPGTCLLCVARPARDLTLMA